MTMTGMDTEMAKLKAIIFDVDGTLADTEEVHRLAFNETFAKFGLDWHWSPELYISLLAISGGRRRIRAYADQHKNDPAVPTDLDDFAKTLHRDKTQRYARMIVEGHVALRPGVWRLLQEARKQRLKLGVATSTAMSNVEVLLHQNLPAGWESWFDCMETCEVIGEQKPSPAIYQAVLKVLDVPAELTIAIEDTENGLRSATGAGLKTIITQHYFTQHHDFTNASLVVNNLGEADNPFELITGNPAYQQPCVDLQLLNKIINSGKKKSLHTTAFLMERTCS